MKLFIALAVLAVCVVGAAKKTTTKKTTTKKTTTKTTTSASASFCTDFNEYSNQYFSDYADRYYKMPLLPNCHANSLKKWKPTYKIEAKTTECPEGSTLWEKRGTCYKEGSTPETFKDAEENCNKMNGHIFVPSDLAEMRWVMSKLYTRGDWHWLGFFCSTGNSHEVRDSRTVTRENTAKIGSKLKGARGGHPLNHQANACWMNQQKDKNWRMKFHHQNCSEKRHYVCEIPISA